MDWIEASGGLGELIERDTSLLNQSSDPRIGSGRNGSTTGTVSAVTSSGTTSSSASSLGSTFVPVLIYSGVCLLIFFSLRRRYPRVYAPRTIRSIRDGDERTPPLPKGWFNWILPFIKVDDSFILNHVSLDGYFFLRYIRVLVTICFAGCVIAYPVLMAVNATGGNGQIQLDLLTIGNVAFPIRFYAHALIAYLLFGFILFMIARESIFYVNLRQAYLMAPQHAHRLSARTVLFTCVPKRFLDERRIRKLFGDGVRNVWIPRNTTALGRLVDERESTAIRLEKAEIELIKKGNAARNKALGIQTKSMTLPIAGHAASALLRLRPKKSPTEVSAATTGTGASAGSGTTAATSSSSSSSVSAVTAASHHEVHEKPDTHEIHELAAMSTNTSDRSSGAFKNAVHEATISVSDHQESASDRHASVSDRHASVSDRHASVSTAPSPSTTIAVPVSATTSTMLNPFDAPHLESGEPIDEEQKNEAKDETKDEVKDEAKNNDAKSKADDDEDEDDDDESEVDEMDYVHPYGYAPNLPDTRGSIAAQWLPAEARPRHRPLANYLRKVDTIRWSRQRLKTLNQVIARSRRRLRAGDGDALSSIFVEFDSQAAAQVAFQVLSHHQPLHMSPRYIGIRPADIIWSSLRMKWWERIIRRFAMMGVVAAGVIFWSIPSAFVGIVSNVEFLSTNVSFLAWVGDLPSVITGVIQGLLPALALSLLMAIVPALLRACARTAGVPSVQLVELFTQHCYFIFQVVQVFLVTTLTSAASAALTQILEDPLSIKDLLSENLPKASNFYLSYITVQCLAGSASALVHPLDLFRHVLLAKSVEHPRRSYRIFQRLKQPHWGSVFPVFTNLGVIAISYACIAPLILVFAGVGMCVTYTAYRYNLLYTFDTDIDSKGLHYPRALMHLMVGLYMAEVCLIGLFSIQSAIGPVVLIALFLIFNVIVHLSMNDAFGPLLSSLPRTLALEDKDLAGGKHDDDEVEGADGERPEHSGGLAADYYDMEEGFGEDDPEDHLHVGPVSDRGLGGFGGLAPMAVGVDGAGDLFGMAKDYVRMLLKEKIKSGTKSFKQETAKSSFGQYLPWAAKKGKKAGHGEGGDGDGEKEQPPNFFVKWLQPQVYEDYTYLRSKLPADAPLPEYPDDYAHRGYWPPEMWQPIPRLWIPRDDARISRQEVDHTGKVLPISDRGCYLTPGGQVEAKLDRAPFKEPRIQY